MATTARMRRHAPFQPTDPKICMSGLVANVINCANFFGKLVSGFRSYGTPKMVFPIENVHRPYNSRCTTLPHFDNKYKAEPTSVQFQCKAAVNTYRVTRWSEDCEVSPSLEDSLLLLPASLELTSASSSSSSSSLILRLPDIPSDSESSSATGP